MIQCINTYCLHSCKVTNNSKCEKCGSPLYVNERLLATKILSNPSNPFSPEHTQVFEATELESSKPVILRVVHSDDKKLVQPLIDTVLALRCIHAVSEHPGIVRLVEEDGYFTWKIRSEDTSDSHCMVTQKIEGCTLHEWAQSNEKISETLAVKWLKQLVDAVSTLHEHGYMHRDIKPENIMVEPNENLVLIDFDAICKMEKAAEGKIPSMGTPRYMAKEQAAGNPRPSSDLYSTGMVIAELIAGEGYSTLSRLDARNELGKVNWPECIQISDQLKDLLDRMTHPNMLRRPVSGQDVLSILSNAESWVYSEKPIQLASTAKKTIFTKPLAILALSLTALCIGLSAIALSQSPSDADRLLAEGNQLIIAGETDEALKLIEQAIELEPNSAELRNSLALAQSSAGDSIQAIENFEAALQLTPNNPYIIYNLANAYEAVDMDRAITHYTTTAQINSPIQTSALNGLARAYLLTDKRQEAQEILSTLIEQVNTPNTHPTLKMAVFKNAAWAHFQANDFEAANQKLEIAMSADPTQPDTYCLSAVIQQQLRQDNYNDKTTCLLLPSLIDKPELRTWKSQLLPSQSQ